MLCTAELSEGHWASERSASWGSAASAVLQKAVQMVLHTDGL